MALIKRLPRPLATGPWFALEAQLNTKRVTLLEYCARRYELANYVRSSTPLVPSRGATYANPAHRWAVAYPDFWRLDDTDRGWVKLNRGMAIVGIHTAARTSGRSLEEVVETGVRGWEQRIGARTQLISRRPVTLSGDLPAVEVVHHIGTGVVGKSRKVITLATDRVLLIDAETYLEVWPRFEPDFNYIIDSFRAQD